MSLQSFMTTLKSIEAQQVRLRQKFETQRHVSATQRQEFETQRQEFETQKQDFGTKIAKIEAQNDMTTSWSQVVDADRYIMYRAKLLSDLRRKAHKMLPKAAQRAENLEQDPPIPCGHEKTALVRFANFMSEKVLRFLKIPNKYLSELHSAGDVRGLLSTSSHGR